MARMKNEWRSQLNSEFVRAEKAREDGNEGRARVCARRAAGIAIREYFNRTGRQVSGSSAYELLNSLEKSPDILPELNHKISNLTMRVSEDFTLPANVDLIEESRQLCRALLPDWNP